MERRRQPRFKVAASCRVAGAGAGRFEGVTENMSRSGVLFEIVRKGSTGLPNVGERLTVDVDLRPNSIYGRKCLRCCGTVVRVFDAWRSSPRIAVSVAHMTFVASPVQIELVSHTGGRMVQAE